MALFTPEEAAWARLKNPDLSKKKNESYYLVSGSSVRDNYGFVFLRYEQLEGRITAILEFLQNARREIGFNVLNYSIDPYEPGKEYFMEGKSIGFYVGVFVTLDRN